MRPKKCPLCGYNIYFYKTINKAQCSNVECCYKKIWCLVDLYDKTSNEVDFIQKFADHTDKFSIAYSMFWDCLECKAMDDNYLKLLKNFMIASMI